ncbi:MAG: methionine--tRNA ligase [Nitrososphaerota archaeon]
MTVSIEEFKRLELRVGVVEAAERVKGSARLLRLRVDFGDVKRQVLTGLAHLYPPEHFLGRSLVFITNLEPRKIRGEVSEAMLLTAVESDERVVPIVPESVVRPGTPIY